MNWNFNMQQIVKVNKKIFIRISNDQCDLTPEYSDATLYGGGGIPILPSARVVKGD